jgi:predicted patatin/cPLA2 family phospholipase
MIGIIDVSRNITGVYGAGVLNYAADHGISFDYAIGSSSGAANLISFLAGRASMSYMFYYDYATRRDYMSLPRLLKEDASLIDVDLLYEDAFSVFSDYPFDSGSDGVTMRHFYILAAHAETGRAHYFEAGSGNPVLPALKASYTVPIVNEPYMVEGIPFFDGCLADPLPYEKAFADGCEKVIMILARPLNYRRDSSRDRLLSRMMKKRYPQAAAKISSLSALYNRQIEDALKLQKNGKMLILSANYYSPVRLLLKDRHRITDLYHKGYQDAAAIEAFLK